ncbi:MAG: (2Fe-2S)-binding protein [Betaproteobacteria bacterium]|nr:(2Fe-2S)-binding protein [Betaproteobacteria bacterium]
MAERIIVGFKRPASTSIEVDGQVIVAYEGETVASAVMAAHINEIRQSRRGHPRGIYCNMGVCFECSILEEKVGADGISRWLPQRACLLLVRTGMRLRTLAPAGEQP